MAASEECLAESDSEINIIVKEGDFSQPNPKLHPKMGCRSQEMREQQEGALSVD